MRGLTASPPHAPPLSSGAGHEIIVIAAKIKRRIFLIVLRIAFTVLMDNRIALSRLSEGFKLSSMCDDYEDDSLDEIEELFSIIPAIDTSDDDEDEESQYEDLDDERFDIDF